MKRKIFRSCPWSRRRFGLIAGDKRLSVNHIHDEFDWRLLENGRIQLGVQFFSALTVTSCWVTVNYKKPLIEPTCAKEISNCQAKKITYAVDRWKCVRRPVLMTAGIEHCAKASEKSKEFHEWSSLDFGFVFIWSAESSSTDFLIDSYLLVSVISTSFYGELIWSQQINIILK